MRIEVGLPVTTEAYHEAALTMQGSDAADVRHAAGGTDAPWGGRERGSTLRAGELSADPGGGGRFA